MFWDKIRRLFRKKSAPKCVYAGPEYFERKNQSSTDPDLRSEPKCVYAGPEYFKRQRRKTERAVEEPEPICVYAGPEPDIDEPEIEEPKIEEPVIEEPGIDGPEIAAPVYAGPAPYTEENVPEPETEKVIPRRPRFGRVYAGPAFCGGGNPNPKKPRDPGSIAQPVYAAPVPRAKQQNEKGERKKYPDPGKEDNDIQEVYGGPDMM